MSVNIFKNGILSKIAGAVGDAVPLINNFLTNQEGKGAADANTVYVLNNKIEEVNSSLGGYSFIQNPNVIALVSDGSIYKDSDGYYVLANSDTGITLLKNTETYTTTTAEGDFFRVIGADSVRPFLKGSSYRIQTGTISVSLDRNVHRKSVEIVYPEPFEKVPTMYGGYAINAIYIGVNNITNVTENGMTISCVCSATNGQSDTIQWFAISEE